MPFGDWRFHRRQYVSGYISLSVGKTVTSNGYSFSFPQRAQHSTKTQRDSLQNAMQVSPAPVAFECPSDSSPTTSLSSTPQNPRRSLSFCRSADHTGTETSSARAASSPVGTGARSPAGSDARNLAHRTSMDVPVLAHSLTASYHTLNLTTPHSLYSQPLTHPDDPSDAAP